MTALTHPPLVSVEDYLSNEENSPVKSEYLGGVVHAMAGASNDHNQISSNLTITLGSQLRGTTCRALNSDTKVRIHLADHVRFYYPDGMVVCEPNAGSDHFHDRPIVLAEVLSDSTRRVYLSEKKDAYLAIPSLRVLLLIESQSPCVTVHRRRETGGFESEYYNGLDAVIRLPEIDSEIQLSELYERIEFS